MTPPIDPIAFYVGPLEIRWYGIIVATAMMTAVWVAARRAERAGLDPELIYEAALWILPISLLGARLYEVFVLSWPYYRTHPGEILAIWQGGLAIHGGLIAGVATGAWFAYRRRLDFWRWADAIAPGIALAQAIGRWGNFFNQEAYGSPAPDWVMQLLPGWIREQMFINGAYMHPTFLYESIWNLLTFVTLIALDRRGLPKGALFFAYFVLYNIGRFAIESIRMDSSFIGSLRIAQLVAAALVLIGLAGIWWRATSARRSRA